METNDKNFLARLSLILFVIGITSPFLLMILTREDVAMGFGVVTEILALVFGVISWKHRFGKIAVIGVCILIAISGVRYIAYLSLRKNSKTEMIQIMESRQTKAEQDVDGNPLAAP